MVIHNPATAEALLWILRLLCLFGLVTGLAFLLSWWPKVDRDKRWTLPVLDVGGWVAAFVVVFGATLINIIFWPTPNHDPDIVRIRLILIVMVGVVDAAMAVRALHWRRIRRNTGNGNAHRRKTEIMENPL